MAGIYDMATAIRQPDAGNLFKGIQAGQQMADQRRQNQARNALARLQQGDQSAMAELQQADPDAAMKYGEYQRAEETRNGLQGFFKPATGATNVVGVNSLSALANGQPAQPAGYDFSGAMNYAAGRGDLEQAASLAQLRDKMQPQSSKYYGGDAQEVVGKDGQRRLIAMTEQGPVELPYQPVSKPKYKFMDDGTVIDETTATPVGRIPVGMSPAQKIQWMQFQASQNKPQMVATDVGFEWVAPGQAPVGKPPQKGRDLSPTEFKELVDTEDRLAASQSVISSLNDAIAINGKAYSGPAALSRAKGRSLLGGDTSAADATVTLNNIISEQALSSLKTVFGGNPTEGERAILLEMQASVEKTPEQREAIMRRAITAANRRIEAGRSRAEALRGGTFTKPQQPANGASAYQEYKDAFSRAKTPEQRRAITERARQNGVVR